MKKRELSRLDFEAIDEVFRDALSSRALKEGAGGNIDRALYSRVERLRDLFRAAHTGWLEVEEDE